MDEPLEVGITAVLLAAGAGTRLGLGAKALLPFRGRVLVEVLTEVLLDGGCGKVVVVLGAEADRVLERTNLTSRGIDKVRVVVNPGWPSGMAGSFRLGLEAAPADDHVIIALVDQPGLNARTVQALLAAHRPGRVTAAAYPNVSGKLRRGHPLLLDASLRVPAAESATGDSGARTFLQTHPRLLDLVDCSSYSNGKDLDTQEHLYLLD